MPLIKAIENGTGQTESLSDELREMWCCRPGYSLVGEFELKVEHLGHRG